MKTALQLVEELAASRTKQEEERVLAYNRALEEKRQELRDFWEPVIKVVDEVRESHPDAVSAVRFEDYGFPWFACCGDVFRLERLIGGVRISTYYRQACQDTSVAATIPFVISTLADAVRQHAEKKKKGN